MGGEKQYSDLARQFDERVKKMVPIQVSIAKVTAYDEEKYTIEVEYLTKATQSEIRLKAGIDGDKDGFIQIPVIGSTVLLGLIGNDRDTSFVMCCNKVAKHLYVSGTTTLSYEKDVITWVMEAGKMYFDHNGNFILNDGNNGGMVIIQALKDDLNKLKDAISLIKNAIDGAAVVPMDGGAALKTNIITALASMDLPTFSSIENTKVKH